MKQTIINICSIKFGLYEQPKSAGAISYLQARQFNDQGKLITMNEEFVTLNEKTEPYLLKDGDVLFVGKGSRLFSWCYREDIGPAIASSIFFILRPDQKLVYPEYLAAVLNAPQSQTVFKQIGGGTNIFSIRKSELGAFEISLPSMTKQKRIAALTALHQQEIHTLEQLAKQKQNLYTAILSKLLKD